jgi:hypothetical protein
MLFEEVECVLEDLDSRLVPPIPHEDVVTDRRTALHPIVHPGSTVSFLVERD